MIFAALVCDVIVFYELCCPNFKGKILSFETSPVCVWMCLMMWCEFFQSGHDFREAAALMWDNVTPRAVAEMFQLWITEIIPLASESVLPETVLTSTGTCFTDLCVCECVWLSVCVDNMLSSMHRLQFCLYLLLELLPKLRHREVVCVPVIWSIDKITAASLKANIVVW